jgi:hypothetical protein
MVSKRIKGGIDLSGGWTYAFNISYETLKAAAGGYAGGGHHKGAVPGADAPISVLTVTEF